MPFGAKWMALASIVAAALFCNAAMAQDAFYQASDAEIAGQPGTVIRDEPMLGAAAGANAHRVLTDRPRPTASRSPSPASSSFPPVNRLPAAGRSWPGRTRPPASSRAARRRLPFSSSSRLPAAGRCSNRVTPSPRPIIPASAHRAHIPIWSARAKRGRSSIPCAPRDRSPAWAPPIATPCGDIRRADRLRCSPASFPEPMRRNCSLSALPRPRPRRSWPPS